MKRALKIVLLIVGVPLLLLLAWIAADQIPYSRAKPPRTVTNVVSCLAWLKEPKSAFRITTDDAVYYQVTGPAGRYLASGPAGYSFDARGRFIGWSADIGDFKTPPQLFGGGAKREKISLHELRQSLN
jgi:hypothetical protein